MEQNTIFKSFIKFVSLNVLGMIGMSCYILADTFFVSNGLGANGLASLNLAISVYSFIHGSGLMIGIGGATRYTILKSQGEDETANLIFTHSIVLGSIIGIIFMMIGIFASEPLSRLLGANESTFTMTNIYLKTILCFSPCFILNNVMIAFIRNDGDPRLSMTAMLIGSFSNVILDYIFIFPLGMGMFGAAFATGLAPIFSMLILSTHIIKQKNQFYFKKVKLKICFIKDICGLGLSSLITEISSGIVLIVFNLVILKLAGNIGIAAYGIVANLALVAVAIFTGIAQGIQPLVSKYYGLSLNHNLKEILRYACTLSLIISVIIYLATYIFSENLVSIFNEEGNIILANFAINGIRLYFIGFIFAGINIITASFLSSTEKPKKAFLLSITRGCIAITFLVLILSYIFGMNGVWISFPLSEAIASIIAIVYLLKYNSINNKKQSYLNN